MKNYLMLALLFLAGCSLTTPGYIVSVTPPTVTQPTIGQCLPTQPSADPGKNPYTTHLEEFSLVAPSGARLYGFILRPDPDLYPGLCFAAVVLVPGGINPGRTIAYAEEATLLAGAGMVVLTFNSEGRVDERAPDDLLSEGSQDYNGYHDQDGLCAVVQYAMQLDYVIVDNIGISTQSFGITMAAGCAARHPEVLIKYIVDGEGPPDNFVTTHEPSMLDDDPSNDKVEEIYAILGHYNLTRDPSPENEAFWSEREAIRFIPLFRGYYLRLQATWDHAQQPDSQAVVADFTQPPLWWQNKHTTDIVNVAVAGGVPWVRVNLPGQGNAVNATYDFDHPPVYLPGQLADKPWSVYAILEMARMP